MLASSSATSVLRGIARQSRLAASAPRVAAVHTPAASSSSTALRLAAARTTSSPAQAQRSASIYAWRYFSSTSCSRNESEGKSGSGATTTDADKPDASASNDNASKPTNGDGGASKEADAHAAALKEKDAKIKELNDALLYARADMQNLMRRTAEDKANASDYAITKLARDLTSSLDILQIALRSVPASLRAGAEASTAESSATEEDPRRALVDLYSGLELTERSLLDMLKSHGVTDFDPTGEKFDPAFHEALYQAPVPDKTPGTVLECQKRGYKIKNRVLRPAQVGVVQG